MGLAVYCEWGQAGAAGRAAGWPGDRVAVGACK